MQSLLPQLACSAGRLALAVALTWGASCEPAPVAASPTSARPATPPAVEAPELPRPPRPAPSVDEPVHTPGDVGGVLTVHLLDLPGIVERRRLRVLVPYARPFFFVENLDPRGLTYEWFREYAYFLEERAGLRRGDLQVVYVPCDLDAALPWLRAGYGDVAAAQLTITPERAREVAFSAPLVDGVREIVVASAHAPELSALDDLAGREVWVARSSSYVEHLLDLSDELVARGFEPVDVVEAPATLATEDLLEMVHAGILDYVVCDHYKAELWSRELSGLHPREDLVVHDGGALAWAVRPASRELLASLDAFVAQARKGTLLGNVLIKRHFTTTRWLKNPTDAEGRARIERYAGWIRELADEYGFDWLRIAAQCFQESGFDPNARSQAGAMGLMQLMPATAADMGCEDPYDPEANLRAGVKYLDWLRQSYFADPELDEVDRTDFILAAYNAGPGNVRRWRRQAQERGLDPDRWRGSVELLALEGVGVQPLHYVDNIEKYFVAYTLALELAAAREAAFQRVREGR